MSNLIAILAYALLKIVQKFEVVGRGSETQLQVCGKLG